MAKLNLEVTERELATIRAALFVYSHLVSPQLLPSFGDKTPLTSSQANLLSHRLGGMQDAPFFDDEPETMKKETPTVHALWQGFALCGFNNSIHIHWPKNHLWVPPSDLTVINCGKCLPLAKEWVDQRRSKKSDAEPPADTE